MALQTLSNGQISVTISDVGAELMSITGKTGSEYLWYGEPEWWEYRAPVLFPIVGGLIDNVYRYKGRSYPMNIHGFARDMVFDVIEKTETTIRYRLYSNCETIEKYPFPFRLDITYALEGDTITVGWNVENTGDEMMYYSIGAHPAFLCPPKFPGETIDRYDCSIQLDCKDQFSYPAIEQSRLLDRTEVMKLDNGRFPIEFHTFDHDALIIDGNETKHVSLLDPHGDPYVTVTFDMPLVGIWSPPGNAPFVCIEPWFGRSDAYGFTGSFEERPFTNSLEAGKVFSASYTVQFPREGK